MLESVIVRRKRLLYRSRYRGCLEGDLLFGGFAERHLASLDATQLDRYEALLAESDPDLLAWIGGQQPVPKRHDHDVLSPAARLSPEPARRLIPPSCLPVSIETTVAEPALNVLADRPRPASARRLVTAAVEGLDALYLAQLLEETAAAQVLYVARDGVRANQLAEMIAFFAPELAVAVLPAWDCLPYDRVSPHADVMAARLDALARLLEAGDDRPRLVVTTVNALLQKVPPPDALRSGLFVARAGERIDRAQLLACLARNGYRRSGTVVEPGEYAVRGGIIDIFPSGSERPLRLDLFGDELERIRTFDPLTQRSLGEVGGVRLRPVSEVLLDGASIERFRVGYLKQFGAVTGDPLFESVSAGRPYPGMEHWLPLFHERLVPITDYLAPDCALGFDHLGEEALESRQETIGEHYEARRHPPEAARAMGAAPYRPLPPGPALPERARARRAAGGARPFRPGAVCRAARDGRGRERRSRRQARARFRGRAGAAGPQPVRRGRRAPPARARGRQARRDRRGQRRLARAPAHGARRSRRRSAAPGGALGRGRGRRRHRARGAASGARLRHHGCLCARRGGHRRRSPEPPGPQGPPLGPVHRRGRGARRRRSGGPSRPRHRPVRRPGHAEPRRRAPRLPAPDLPGRRQAVRAGRAPGRALALRRGRRHGPAGQAGRPRLAGAQGQGQEADPRDRGRADRDRGQARACAKAP